MPDTSVATDDGEQTAVNQYLAFNLAGEEYAIEILRVQEIKGDTTVARMPNTAEYVLGVTNLRGAIIPIIDLRRKFRLPAATAGSGSVVVIVLVATKTVGVSVDAVTDVVDIPPADVQPTPDLASSIDGALLSGIAHVGDRLIALLDLDRMLGADVSAAAA